MTLVDLFQSFMVQRAALFLDHFNLSNQTSLLWTHSGLLNLQNATENIEGGCYTQSRAPGCTTSCAASDGTTVRQFTIKTPTMLEFEYNVFIYKIYSQTTHFT